MSEPNTDGDLELLTRSECAERKKLIANVAYRVDLDLSKAAVDDPQNTFRSRTTITFDAEQDSSTWIDLIAESIQSVTLNGRGIDPSQAFNGARIQLAGLESSNTLEIDALCLYMRSGEGLHRFRDPVDNETYLYSQFEVADARRMYACFDQPSIKATFELRVDAPGHWQVVSNSETPTPENVSPDGSTMRWSFAASPPMSTYITALVAGPYFVVRDEYSGKFGTYPLGLFCRNSLAEHLDADDIFELTKQGFEFYEEAFDTAYPFGKYDQLFVPEFNAGAMENAGCVTFLEDYVFRSRVTDAAYEQRANTILHELAHMWFGNLVTMEWWDDLWLNESFAEWASHHANVKATRYSNAWTTFQSQRKAWAYRQDQLPSTHPISADMVDLDAVRANFDGITYAKGAAALRQLVAWVGEDAFIQGLRDYFTKHAWGNTELRDLLNALENSSGRDLSSWSSQWLETTGVNTVTPQIELNADQTYKNVSLIQTPPNSPENVDKTLRDHRLAVGLYDFDSDRNLVRRHYQELDLVGSSTSVPELQGLKQADLLLPNDDDLTFAKIRLDERSASTAVSSIGSVENSLARALLWGAAWDMTRDAEMPTRDFTTMTLEGIKTEPDVGVVQQLLRQLRLAVNLYANPSKRELYCEIASTNLRALLASAEPKSDHQLAFARGFISFASSSEDLDLIEGLYMGSQSIDGLTIDTDMRWNLLIRLCIAGRVGADEIDAEKGRDATAQGIRAATTCFASLPGIEAKEAAWNEVLDNQELANHLLAATIDGIMVPEHRELLAPFVDRYFASIPTVWSSRTPEMAQQIVSGLYPALLTEAGTITKTEEFLAHNANLAPSARRLVVEGLDTVMRALRCQERDER